MEIVFNSHDYATLLADAERLGFTYDDAEGNPQIIVNGPISTGGSYFLNVIGTIYEPVVPPTNPDDPWPAPVPREGYYGRLRLNGTPETMPGFDPAITQYVYQQGDMDTPGGWVNAADGTPAPEWVATVGVIA
jgi:hypothetical protein